MPFNLPNLFHVILQPSFKADVLQNCWVLQHSKNIYHRLSIYAHYIVEDHENSKDTSD